MVICSWPGCDFLFSWKSREKISRLFAKDLQEGVHKRGGREHVRLGKLIYELKDFSLTVCLDIQI